MPPVFVVVFGGLAKGALDDVLLMVLRAPFVQSHFALNVSSEDSVPMLKMIFRYNILHVILCQFLKI